jgi:hypothetical protein
MVDDGIDLRRNETTQPAPDGHAVNVTSARAGERANSATSAPADEERWIMSNETSRSKAHGRPHNAELERLASLRALPS